MANNYSTMALAKLQLSMHGWVNTPYGVIHTLSGRWFNQSIWLNIIPVFRHTSVLTFCMTLSYHTGTFYRLWQHTIWAYYLCANCLSSILKSIHCCPLLFDLLIVNSWLIMSYSLHISLKIHACMNITKCLFCFEPKAMELTVENKFENPLLNLPYVD